MAIPTVGKTGNQTQSREVRWAATHEDVELQFLIVQLSAESG